MEKCPFTDRVFIIKTEKSIKKDVIKLGGDLQCYQYF